MSRRGMRKAGKFGETREPRPTSGSRGFEEKRGEEQARFITCPHCGFSASRHSRHCELKQADERLSIR